MQPLARRTLDFTDSVIRRMTRISNQFGAVNLSQGFPDFDPPAELTGALATLAPQGPHQYAITWGAKNFREALAQKHTHFTGLAVNPETDIVVTCGSTEAMLCSMMSVVNPGDKVAVFSPFYENYGADAILSGAEPLFIPLRPPKFDFDPADLEKAFAHGARVLILCNPANPCGKVFTRAELLEIARLAEKYDVYVVTDEVYEHIVYAPHKHISFATLPGMRERTLTCGSLSKTYSVTGWRLGYIISNARIIDTARKVHDFLTVGAAAPLQEAAVTALHFPDRYYLDLQAKYTHLRDYFLAGLDKAGIPHTTPEGAYYVLADISEFGYESDLEFCELLAEKTGVGAVPGSSFFRENVQHLIRFHFAKKESTLSEALARLMHIRETMPKRSKKC